jgi:hypothetical protein
MSGSDPGPLDAVGAGLDGVPTARLLEEVEVFVRRFVVLSEAQSTATALWVPHTHTFEAVETTPYLAVTSAEKRSGKTRLLEVLELLVHVALPTANISDAALFRGWPAPRVARLLGRGTLRRARGGTARASRGPRRSRLGLLGAAARDRRPGRRHVA